MPDNFADPYLGSNAQHTSLNLNIAQTHAAHAAHAAQYLTKIAASGACVCTVGRKISNLSALSV